MRDSYDAALSASRAAGARARPGVQRFRRAVARQADRREARQTAREADRVAAQEAFYNAAAALWERDPDSAHGMPCEPLDFCAIMEKLFDREHDRTAKCFRSLTAELLGEVATFLPVVEYEFCIPEISARPLPLRGHLNPTWRHPWVPAAVLARCARPGALSREARDGAIRFVVAYRSGMSRLRRGWCESRLRRGWCESRLRRGWCGSRLRRG